MLARLDRYRLNAREVRAMRYDKSSYHRGMFLTNYPVVTKSDTPPKYGLPLKKPPPTSLAEIKERLKAAIFLLAEIARSVRRGTG